MEKKMIKIGIVMLLLTMIGGIHGQEIYSAELKIGTVDLQKAINECNAGREAKKALSLEIDKFQRLIADRQKELQEMK